MRWFRFAPAVIVLTASLPSNLLAGDAKPLEFHLTFDKNLSEAPFTGRVFVIASKAKIADLPPRPAWFNPEPFFAWDVKDWKPGETLVLRAADFAFPDPLAKLPKGEYSLQAVIDFDRGGQNPLACEGNGHSKPVRMTVDPATIGPVKLHVDQVYPGRKFDETERVKLVDIPSTLLTKF